MAVIPAMFGVYLASTSVYNYVSRQRTMLPQGYGPVRHQMAKIMRLLAGTPRIRQHPSAHGLLVWYCQRAFQQSAGLRDHGALHKALVALALQCNTVPQAQLLLSSVMMDSQILR
jgi:hypothetical protein